MPGFRSLGAVSQNPGDLLVKHPGYEHDRGREGGRIEVSLRVHRSGRMAAAPGNRFVETLDSGGVRTPTS